LNLSLIYTATADNGKEFAFHQRIAEALEIDVFFARHYHSWERGANENTNGLIRQYFPKGTDFETITEQQIQDVEIKLNNRPRKRFEYMTPNEMFLKLTGTFG
jgi:IS30 family transposase